MDPEGDLSPHLLGQIGYNEEIPMIVVGMHRLVDLLHFDLDTQFFLDFPHEALLGGFAVLQLTAWELPFPRQGSSFALAE